MSEKESCNMNIPLDLTVEILKKLPTKSLARFQCVSRQWTRIIRDFIVIDSIVVRSVTQPPRDPHFIFSRYNAYKRYLVFSYAYPHHQITNEKHLYHVEVFEETTSVAMFQYVRGLIGHWSFSHGQFTIYNPTTRQSVHLPDARLHKSWHNYLFGYDPLMKQYKVVCLTQTKRQPKKTVCQVFTLGDPKKEWVDIECGIGYHFSIGTFVCINGKIYYIATFLVSRRNSNYFLVSFDVGTHKFNRVQLPYNLPVRNGNLPLINFQGKLACICQNYYINSKDVDMWVMENAEKKEWSKFIFVDMLQGLTNVSFVGVTAQPSGEIVIFHENLYEDEVYYYDTKLNIRRRVEIKTATPSERIRPVGHFNICLAVAEHVENIMCLSSCV